MLVKVSISKKLIKVKISIHRNLQSQGILISLLVLLGCGQASIFRCVFEMSTIGAIGEVYICTASWEPQGQDTRILEKVEGKHLTGKSNANVEHLSVETRPDFIPKDIDKFFPNLKSLRWYKTNLSEISREDLRPFPQLIVLYLPVNQLLVIDGNLFSLTPNLRWISFIQNQIRHVGPDLLTNLNELERAFFNENPCIDDYASDREGIMRLNDLLPNACPLLETTTVPVASTTIPSTTELSTNSPGECSEACLKRIEVSEREISILHDEISKLHDSNDRLNAENESQHNEIASLNDEVLKLRSFSEALAGRVEEIEKQLRELPSHPSF